MTLLEKQFHFAEMTQLLFHFLSLRGYKWKYGDAKRDTRCPYGNPRSLHHISLAIDILLFKKATNGKMIYLEQTDDYKEAGEFWESIGGSWGGRFNDGNHFSLEHEGRK